MGNTSDRNEGELNAELRNNIRICQEVISNEAVVEADLLRTSIESRVSCDDSSLIEIFTPVEDALSLNTDSSRTEYESAPEDNDDAQEDGDGDVNGRSETTSSIGTNCSQTWLRQASQHLAIMAQLIQSEDMTNISTIEMNNMQCNENKSEAGPDSGTDFNVGNNNIPFLNDTSDLEFMSKMGGTGLVAENLRKQSLYVKFDPLVTDEANTTQNGDLSLRFDQSLNISGGNGDKGDSMCGKEQSFEKIINVSNASDKKNTSYEADSKSKIDNLSENVAKLISVTPNKSPRKVTPRSSPKYAEMDLDDATELKSLLFKQMKKEETFKAENEELKCENERLLQKLYDFEKEMNVLKTVLETTRDNEKKLKNEIMERTKNTQQLSAVLGEYEKTISQMLTKREEEKNEYETTVRKIEAERDSTVHHLNNLENAFNDIHQKYERGKAVNEALKKNEDLLKKSLNDYEVTVKTVENKYELLKSHATSQLDKANQELELITQSYEKEQAKLQAMLRKSEIQISSLQNALERKTSENQELTAICDELIVKLSTHSAS